MITDTICLWEGNETIHLDTYLLYNSAEYQTDCARPAVIVCPGGAYHFTSDREAEPIALRFLAHGYHAFVLRYSVQTLFPQPMLDLARAVATVRDHAAEWHVDPDRIAVCGFSAGGHLCASLGVSWDKPFLYEPLGLGADQIRPNALILGYPVVDLTLVTPTLIEIPEAAESLPIGEAVLAKTLGSRHPDQADLDRYRADLHVSSATPPTFLWHTADDELVPARNSLLFATALAEHGVPYELHIFDHGLHGLALADDVTATPERGSEPHCQIWMDLAIRWLSRQP